MIFQRSYLDLTPAALQAAPVTDLGQVELRLISSPKLDLRTSPSPKFFDFSNKG
jgi:hypothetical protein